MKCYKLNDNTQIQNILTKLDVSTEGIKILQKKSKLLKIFIKNLRTPAANILKQEALSVGADLCVPKSVITCETKYVDCVLMTNQAQLKSIILKSQTQPFLLKDLGVKLKEFLSFNEFEPCVMGVANINDDSFYEKSRTKEISKIEQLISDGASIIDIGAVSSRPSSKPVSPEEELKRLKFIADEIYRLNLTKQAKFSLDSYEPLPIQYALDRGFKIINDITGLENDKVAHLAAQYNASVCIMHMQNNPHDMQLKPEYENVIIQIDDFFENQIQKAKDFGIKDIILDVGIGFGKNLTHNLALLKHHEHFLHFGYPLLFGASRKSMINDIIKTPVEDRLAGSIVLHYEALNQGASIIRVHDVKEHFTALKIWQSLRDLNYEL